jgi:hypothetical protein
MSARYNFCTLFDSNYATRGLSLYRSLVRNCRSDFQLTILCMDEPVRHALARLDLPHVRLWQVEDIGDAELLAVRETRPRREFCWTCPGPLLISLLNEAGPDSIVTYLDADLGFYSDLKPLYDELGDKDILIHGHNFAPRYASYAKASGIFNVGLIAIRNAPEGMACLNLWRSQNLEKCELDPENGYCGDQKYLDEWPSLYKKLVISKHPGVGLAPWNVEAHRIGKERGQVTVDDQPLIFYHYHALRILLAGGWKRWAALPAMGYDFTPADRDILYKPYIRMLRESEADLRRAGLSMEKLKVSPRQLLEAFKLQKLVVG